jgi:hypothetical protein
MSRFKAKLKNLYVYFWRWATWKVWESTPAAADGNIGVITFITTSGYLTGPAFQGMREYLRQYASEGWIIDCTPEGQTPDIPTRIFPGVRQPLAIGIFVRHADADTSRPAHLRHRSLTGKRADKFAALAASQLDDDGWRDCRTDWTAPLTPATTSQWDTYHALVLARRIPHPHVGLRNQPPSPRAPMVGTRRRGQSRTEGAAVQGGPRRQPGEEQTAFAGRGHLPHLVEDDPARDRNQACYRPSRLPILRPAVDCR